jgi:hypothetical protein
MSQKFINLIKKDNDTKKLFFVFFIVKIQQHALFFSDIHMFDEQ